MRIVLSQLAIFAFLMITTTHVFAQSFTATADATIKYKYKSSNFGFSSTLEVDRSPEVRTLLKFSVSGISETINSAIVRVYVTNSSKSGPEIYQVSNSWSESTVTYSTQPSTISSLLDDKGSVSSGKYVDYNVARVVTSNGEFSFLLKADTSDGVDISSRESSRPPALLIQTTGTTATPTPTPTPTPSPTPESTSEYEDDTFSILSSGVATKVISGDFGYSPYTLSQAADGKALALDLRQASWIVANSKNVNPTYSYDCNYGSLSINKYPIQVKYDDQVSLVGVLIHGKVPQESDWEPTYCNSAAILFREGASSGLIDGVRITSSWDAVRNGNGADHLTVKNSWFSDVRDDVVENDYLHNLNYIDNLVDGTFQGISTQPSSTYTGGSGSSNTVLVSGTVMRIRSYIYKGNPRYGSLFKTDAEVAPMSKVYNSVIAVDPGSGSTISSSNWADTWKNMVDCKNNLFLWMSDREMTTSLGTIPSCFRVIKGQAAIDAWNKAKANWINCHPKVRRSSTDSASDFSQCRANDFGGFTN